MSGSINPVPPVIINVILFAGIPIFIAGVAAVYRLVAKRSDDLGERFTRIDSSIETLKADLAKTKSTVAFIRGQLVGTESQRRSRRIKEENGDNGMSDD
jgi:hypothetical protein